MRFLLPAVAFLLALSALATWDLASAASPSTAPAGAAPPTAAAPAKPGNAATGSSADDAAAKHAKLTACIHQARAKKLVGSQKTAFIKGCIGAP
jgi:hypothetical protein